MRELIAGKSIGDALLLLAMQPLVPSVERLKEQVTENAERYILSNLFPKVILGRDGKVAARQRSMRAADPGDREAALRAEMFQLAALHHSVAASATINPARRQIVRDHPIRSSDLLSIVGDNPLIPEGRETLLAEGLHAGFIGDLPKAIHLLIPQFEHALRVFLSERGHLVSSLDNEGIQDERNLNTLLYAPYVETLERSFGPDLVFALQGLLVERFGANLRNEMAHGLLDTGDFFSPPAFFTWWLMLRYCCLPTVACLKADASQDTELSGPIDEAPP